MVPNFMMASDLRAWRLVKPFAIEVRQPGRWYLICRREQRGDARTTRFRDWSAPEIAADRRWQVPRPLNPATSSFRRRP
jgi:LysR family glycine cleavage system transcriptional activator